MTSALLQNQNTPPSARHVARMSHSEHIKLEMFDLFSSHFPCAQLSASSL